MNKLLSSMIAGVLAGTAFSAAAETDVAPVFGYDSGIIVLAQQQTVEDYQKYIDRMMDESTTQMLDENADGQVTRKEFRQFYNEIFGMMDKNHDDMITSDEMPKTVRPDG